MGNHPVCEVSWYGATAFCDYYGYRLPTEWEWQAVADFNGTYTYGCGTTISQTKANYVRDNPLGFSDFAFTTPVDHYSSYGYGINDMAGNIWEWTSSLYDPYYDYITIRGGGWNISDTYCTASYRNSLPPHYTYHNVGFRVCR